MGSSLGLGSAPTPQLCLGCLAEALVRAPGVSPLPSLPGVRLLPVQWKPSVPHLPTSRVQTGEVTVLLKLRKWGDKGNMWGF